MSQNALLITTQSFYFENPKNGASLRVQQNYNALRERYNVDVLILGLEEKRETLDNGSLIEAIDIHKEHKRSNKKTKLIRKLKIYLKHNPELMLLYDSYEIRKRINRLHVEKQYKFVLLEEIALASYVKTFISLKVPIVYDAHNVEAKIRNEIDKDRENGNNRFGDFGKIELDLFNKATISLVCSSGDKDLVNTIYGVDNIITIPNCLDVEKFSKFKEEKIKNDYIKLTYIGTYHYYPNEKAALELINEIVPAIEERGEKVELSIVGKGATEKMIVDANNNENIIIHGEVESLENFYSEDSIFAMPIRLGGGTRLKVLEAFAIGNAVVCTEKACEGIECENGKHLYVAESTKEFVDKILYAFKNPDKVDKVLDQAYELVWRRYSWNSVKESLLNSISEAIEEKP